jgi:hypothetical protein
MLRHRPGSKNLNHVVAMAKVFPTILHIRPCCRGFSGRASRVSAAVSLGVSADASRNCLISLNCVGVLAASHEVCV